MRIFKFILLWEEYMTMMHGLYQEFVGIQQDSRSVADCFVAFERVYEELNDNVPLVVDMKKIHKEGEGLAVLVLLGEFCTDYVMVQLQILGDTFSRVLRSKWQRGRTEGRRFSIYHYGEERHVQMNC